MPDAASMSRWVVGDHHATASTGAAQARQWITLAVAFASWRIGPSWQRFEPPGRLFRRTQISDSPGTGRRRRRSTRTRRGGADAVGPQPAAGDPPAAAYLGAQPRARSEASFSVILRRRLRALSRARRAGARQLAVHVTWGDVRQDAGELAPRRPGRSTQKLFEFGEEDLTPRPARYSVSSFGPQPSANGLRVSRGSIRAVSLTVR